MQELNNGHANADQPTLVVHRRHLQGSVVRGRSQVTQYPEYVEELRLPVVPGYEILGILGSGGMGVVYKARQLGLDRLVALKMIHPEASNDPEVLGRFQAEAAAIARLRHPGIVQVFEIGQHADRPYLCLEYVEGTTLDDWIGGKPQDPRSAALLVEQLALALHHAHEQGIIHRDMKPANVLLDAAHCPRVTDFGIAHFLQNPSGIVTRNNELLGTPTYMAPEQASHGPIRATTDVYALGVILYELLTGHPPFVAPTGLETIHLVLKAEPVSPRRLQPGLSRDLETITLKCLQKEPHRRYPNARALAEDLRHWIDGEPILARPITSVDRLLRWCRRNPVLTTLTVALSLTVLALVIAGTLWWRASEQRRITDEQAATRREEERHHLMVRLQRDLGRITTALAKEDVESAREVLHYTEGLLHQQSESQALAANLAESRRLIQLVLDLEQVRARLGQARGDSFDSQGRSEEMARIFAPLGVTIGRPFDETWIEPLRQSTVRWAIIRALDLWAILRTNEKDVSGFEWLLRLNNQLDEDAWCAEARQEVIDRNITGLVQRAQQACNEKHPRDRWRLLGPLLRLCNQKELAKDFYRAGLLQYPDDFLIVNSLGLLLMEEEKDPGRQEALGCFRAALAIRPNSAGVQLNAGCMLDELGQYTEALAAHRRAIELQPDYASAHFNQAVVLMKLNRSQEAIPAFRRAVELEPERASYHFHLVMALGRMGRIEEFQAALRHIEERQVFQYDLARRLVQQLDHLGQKELALKAGAFCIEHAPDRAEMLYDQGTSLLELSRHPEAVRFLRRATELQPEHAESQCNLGLALLELGELEEAVERLCQGHQLGSSRPRWDYPSDRWLAEAHALHLLEQQLRGKNRIDQVRQLDLDSLKRLAKLASIQQQYTLSTRAYQEVMARGATDPTADSHRVLPWLTARAAMRAALDLGEDTPPPEQREALAALAYHLVLADVNQLTVWLNSPTPSQARYVQSFLQCCLANDTILDLRRLATGESMPPADRARWKHLFDRAEELQARAQRLAEAPR